MDRLIRYRSRDGWWGSRCFPRCDRPPEWCERHHIRGWIDGGATDLYNLTLLCRYHHHFEQRGWFCQLNDDGIPEWLPPRWVDPHQTPQTNTQITAAHTIRRHRLRRWAPADAAARQCADRDAQY